MDVVNVSNIWDVTGAFSLSQLYMNTSSVVEIFSAIKLNYRYRVKGILIFCEAREDFSEFSLRGDLYAFGIGTHETLAMTQFRVGS